MNGDCMDLNEVYEESYRLHPNFQFLESNLNLNEDLVLEFENSYGNPKEKGLNAATLTSRLEKAKLVNQKIFQQLSSQISDEHKKLFFESLENEISTYLDSEFKLRGKISNLEKRTSKSNEVLKSRIENLDRDSHFLGSLNQKSVNQILKLSKETITEFRSKVKAGKVKRDDLSVNSGELVKKIGWILDKEFKKTGVFDAVSEFFGIRYDHTGLSLELSTEKSTWWKNKISNLETPKTMYAHLDESYFAPKSIVYLSEVEEFSGPTSCYPGVYKQFNNNPLKDIVGRVIGNVAGVDKLKNYYNSEYHQAFSSMRFREHFMSLPTKIRFNSHFGWDVLPNSKLENYLVGKEKVLLGAAGDFIIFDGAQLLHRGGLINKGERIVLQVIFYPYFKKGISSAFKTKIKKTLSGI